MSDSFDYSEAIMTVKRYFLGGSWTEKGNVIKLLNNLMMYTLQSISTFTALAISRFYFPASEFFMSGDIHLKPASFSEISPKMETRAFPSI